MPDEADELILKMRHLEAQARAQEEARRPILTQEDAAKQPDPLYPGGYGGDPKLVPPHKPGEYWHLTFDEKQKRIATVLADAIIPTDDYGPAAQTVLFDVRRQLAAVLPGDHSTTLVTKTMLGSSGASPPTTGSSAS